MLYTYTPLEDSIKKLYTYFDITQPSQLNMIDMAAKLNIWIHFTDMSSRAIDRNDLQSIVIDRRLSPPEKWLDFGHELCHILRHAGNQLVLPPLFVNMQEYKAHNFMLHFCVPTFMLRRINLPKHSPAAHVASVFNVTHSIAVERLNHYKRQIIQAQRDETFIITNRIKQKELADSYNLKPFKVENCSPETQEIMKQWEDKLKVGAGYDRLL